MGSSPRRPGHDPSMFFFTNSLGCLPSILISVALSVVLFLVFGLL